jgi:hypothetical protein
MAKIISMLDHQEKELEKLTKEYEALQKEIRELKGPPDCTPEALNTLFMVLKLQFDADDDSSNTAELVEPILERFISAYFPDVELLTIVSFLWIWFEHWRTGRAQWEGTDVA